MTSQSTIGLSTLAVPSELAISDRRIGHGDEAKSGSTVTVHYTGWLFEKNGDDFRGRKFDSSQDLSQPLKFSLGARRVIQGWDQGIVGMRVGGVRTLVIPANLAYGAHGVGDLIPPNAPLVFDVELLAVE